MNKNRIQPIVFIGGSTAFFEISEIICAINRIEKSFEIVAILDDDVGLHGTQLDGIPVVGGLDLVHQYSEAQFVFAIGSFKTRLVRRDVLQELSIPDDRFATLIHPRCEIHPGAKIGPGCVVHSGTVICHGAVLGPFSIVAFNSVIGPHVELGRCAMITSMVTVLTGTRIGPSAFIGVGSNLAESIEIGPGAVVIMGSTVLRNVKPGAFVQGNPARFLYGVEIPETLMSEWTIEAKYSRHDR